MIGTNILFSISSNLLISIYLKELILLTFLYTELKLKTTTIYVISFVNLKIRKV